MYLILLCFGTLFGLGAFFLLAGLLRLPTSASTKAVLTVTNRGKAKKNSMNAILFDMAAKAAPLVRLDAYKRRKLEAGIVPRPKGRPRKAAQLRDIAAEQAYEIQRLQMENKLLRDFLQSTGRK